jgi:hypothetical protein
VTHVPREQNKAADTQVNKALDAALKKKQDAVVTPSVTERPVAAPSAAGDTLVITKTSGEDLLPPEFAVKLTYRGCSLKLAAISFCDILQVAGAISELQQRSRGTVLVDGGKRFCVTFSSLTNAALQVSFSAEQTFAAGGTGSGRILVEGARIVEGAAAAAILHGMCSLLADGSQLTIDL